MRKPSHVPHFARVERFLMVVVERIHISHTHTCTVLLQELIWALSWEYSLELTDIHILSVSGHWVVIVYTVVCTCGMHQTKEAWVQSYGNWELSQVEVEPELSAFLLVEGFYMCSTRILSLTDQWSEMCEEQHARMVTISQVYMHTYVCTYIHIYILLRLSTCRFSLYILILIKYYISCISARKKVPNWV